MSRCGCFPLARFDHRSRREFFTRGQCSYPDRLHANAPAQRRDFPARVHAELAPNRYPVHSSQLFGDRYVRHSATRRNDRAKFEIGVRACHHHAGCAFHRGESLPLGKGRKAACLSQTVGPGRFVALLFPWRLRSVEPSGINQSENYPSRSQPQPQLAHSKCAHFCRQREGYRIGRGLGSSRQDRECL